MISQLHRLLLELIPGGANKDLSAAQARALLARVRPRDAAGKVRRRVAAELIGDLERIYQRKKAAGKELRELVAASGSTLTQLKGVGPSGAARLVEVGDITRFSDRAHFASWNGTAPIDASPGEQVRHRLSRAGNRQINRALHIMAVVQLRNPTEGRAYFDRKVAAGKTPMEATRALKRRLSDIVYHQMVTDATAGLTGPGGHSGTTLQSSVTGLTPAAGSSDKPLPGPATDQRRPRSHCGVLIQRGAMTERSLGPVYARTAVLRGQLLVVAAQIPRHRGCARQGNGDSEVLNAPAAFTTASSARWRD